MPRQPNVRRRARGPVARPALVRASLLPIGALAAGFAFAQSGPEKADETDAGTVMPVVRIKANTERSGKASYQAQQTTVGKGKQELRDIPQSVTVVTERLMDDKGQDTLKGALHGLAGIAFEAGEGGGIGDLIRLRGFSARGDMYIDGMRDIAQYNRDNFNIDRAEVLRGSASMLYGRGSTGGIVNQSNKRPFGVDQTQLDLSVGTANYWRGTLDSNLKTGEDAAMRVNAMVTDAGSTRNGPRSRRTGVAPTYNWGIGTPDEFALGFYHLEYRDVPDYGFRWFNDRPVDAAAERWYGTESDYQRDSATYGTLSHTHRFGATSELKTTLRQGHYTRDLWATTAGFAAGAALVPRAPRTLDEVSDATQISRGNQTRGARDNHRFLQSDYSGRLQAFGLRHHLLAGAELADERTRAFGYSGTPAKPNTTWGASGGTGALVDTRVATPSGAFKARTLGTYLQDTLELTPQWKLVAGLRFDRFEGTYSNLSETIPLTWERDDRLWSKRAGVLWQPTVESSYYASASSSFNTTGDLYQFGGSTNPPAAWVTANCAGTLDNACRIAYGKYTGGLSANTPPEESRNFELGAKWELQDGNLSLRTAVFRTEKYNERNTDVDTATQSYLLNAGRHTQGFELEAAGRVGASWELFGSLAWMQGRIDAAAPSVVGTAGDTTGADPGLTPKWTGGVWATWQVAPRWRIGFGADGRSQSKPAGAELTLNRAPGYVKADAMIELDMKPMSFKLNVNNLFDKVYADGIYRGFTVAGATRTIQLTVSTKI